MCAGLYRDSDSAFCREYHPGGGGGGRSWVCASGILTPVFHPHSVGRNKLRQDRSAEATVVQTWAIYNRRSRFLRVGNRYARTPPTPRQPSAPKYVHRRGVLIPRRLCARCPFCKRSSANTVAACATWTCVAVFISCKLVRVRVYLVQVGDHNASLSRVRDA